MGKIIAASFSLGMWFSLVGICVIGWYIGLSIWWKLDCDSFAENHPSQFLECGSWAMFICAGWAPTLVFIWISLVTTKYICEQAQSAIKVVGSARAWLYSFVTGLAMILYFIHFCYQIYMLVQMQDNGCDTSGCDHIEGLLVGLIILTAFTMAYICCGSLGCLFGLVNGRVATPIDRAYQDRIEKQKQERKNEVNLTEFEPEENEEHETRDRDSTALLSAHPGEKYQLDIVEDMRSYNKLGDTNLTDLKKSDRVLVRLSHRNNEGCYGTVHYYGVVPEYPTQYSTTFPYIYGVELDEPKGNTNGVLNNKQYFRCPEQCGVFLAPPDVKKLDPSEDPMTNNSTTIAGVKITRKNPNHFQKEDLSALLVHIQENDKESSSPSSINIGQMKCFRIATVTPNNIEDVTREFLDLLPQNILYAHSLLDETPGGMGDRTTSGLTTDGSNKTGPNVNGMMFNIFPAIGQLYAMDEAEIDMDEYLNSKSGIDLWYIELSPEWRRWSHKIVNAKYVDWSIGKNSDQFNSKWVLTNHWRTQEWVSILLNQSAHKINVPYPVIHESCIPKFIEQNEKLKLVTSGTNTSINISNIKCNPHYIPLGFFREGSLGGELDKLIEKRPAFIRERENVEFVLGNILHESVQNIEELLPYLKYELLDLDEQSEDKNGWFPMDWVYAEVKFTHKELNAMIDAHFNQYSSQHNDDSTTTFNPYYMMKFPRIPLCYLSTLLPLTHLREYADRIEKIKRQDTSKPALPYQTNQTHWRQDSNGSGEIMEPNQYHTNIDIVDEKGHNPDEMDNEYSDNDDPELKAPTHKRLISDDSEANYALAATHSPQSPEEEEEEHLKNKRRRREKRKKNKKEPSEDEESFV